VLRDVRMQLQGDAGRERETLSARESQAESQSESRRHSHCRTYVDTRACRVRAWACAIAADAPRTAGRGVRGSAGQPR
jgi:hypothetical protein